MLQMEIETPPEGASAALEMVALRRQIDVLELKFSQLRRRWMRRGRRYLWEVVDDGGTLVGVKQLEIGLPGVVPQRLEALGG